MKQAQSEVPHHRLPSRPLVGRTTAARPNAGLSRQLNPRVEDREDLAVQPLSRLIVALLAGVWSTVMFPFRFVFCVIAWLGRLTAVTLGFSVMVIGIALWASSLVFVGVPLFLIGLVLTLRCLD
jgi:hypothetical protein